MTFAIIQDQFQRYLLTKDESVFDHMVGTQKVPKAVRMAIYSDGYRLRLIESLRSSYPVLKAYLGDISFEKLCDAFITQFPSPYRNIRWFGDQLPAFLKKQTGYKKKRYLFELAELEWKMGLVFDAEEVPVLQIQAMAALSPDLWPTVKFKIHPAVQRLTLSWDIVPIWEALSNNETPPALIKNTESVVWIAWRKELINYTGSLLKDEACAFDAILAGKTFSEVCEILCDFLPEVEVGQYAAALLRKWIGRELIESFYF